VAISPDELPGYLAAIRQRVGDEGPQKAAYAMAKAFHAELVDVELVKYSHQKNTRTPSPPGEPPAIIGGHLKRSVKLWPATVTGPYRASSKVGPQIVYARIQELGGTVTPIGHPFLRFPAIGGGWVFARKVKLPPRPYMRPVHRRMVQDGRLRQAAIAAIKRLVAGG